MPRSTRRLLHPQDHGSLEDITLHPQLRVLPLEPDQTSALVDGHALLLAPLDPVPVHPIAQRPRVDPEVPGHLSDRLTRLAHDPDRALPKLRVVLPSYLCHGISSERMPPRNGGMPSRSTAAGSYCWQGDGRLAVAGSWVDADGPAGVGVDEPPVVAVEEDGAGVTGA